MPGSTLGAPAKALRGAPLVDPSTLGAKTLHEVASLKYCYNTQPTKPVISVIAKTKHEMETAPFRSRYWFDSRYRNCAVFHARPRTTLALNLFGVCGAASLLLLT